MKFRNALRMAAEGARANLLPGLLLQALMLVFLALYVAHEDTRRFLAQVAALKHEVGYGFAFAAYVLSAAILPEMLRIAFFQAGRVTRRNLWNLLTGAPAWGVMGMVVDAFYRVQLACFGAGNDWQTIVIKVLIDQFVFSPLLSNPLIVGYFSWRDAGFRRAAARRIFGRGFYLERVIPVQVAGWCVWIPGVALVYFMPPELQLPTASLIQAFWVLVFLFVNRPRQTDAPPDSGKDSISG